ncbi:MAG: UDP-3-O-(3-hydroxymyristoyl)glucosamine N-acyltransferase [candidate division Zixibacteria bacterium]|nr:UDP-3-O-(3-hydroxymyristoyl)glucosamine N-acyltransferase [candidate division Zixibacteria bacterium]
MKTLGEIATYLGGKVSGDKFLKIKRIYGIEQAQPGDLTFVANPKYAGFLSTTKASAAIVGEDVKTDRLSLILHPHPYFAFCKALELFHPQTKKYEPGIHPTVSLSKKSKIAKDAHIGPYVVIEHGVDIKSGVTILAGSFIGARTSIGQNSFIYPRVVLREDTIIGKNVIIHSGTVIGSDGFGYVKDKGVHHKILQVGKVVIEDEVEIGANVTIDRATLGETRVGKGTKIDNLVQIAHNVVIGENTLIAAQAGISGSTRIGKDVIIAGQVGLVGHIEIGDRVVVGAQSGVSKSVKSDTFIFGYPAREIHRSMRIEACISQLPEYFKRITQLEKRIKDKDEKEEK